MGQPGSVETRQVVPGALATDPPGPSGEGAGARTAPTRARPPRCSSSLPVARKSFNLSQVSDLMPLVQSRELRVDSGDGPDDLLSTHDPRLSTRGSGASGQHHLSDRSMACRAGPQTLAGKARQPVWRDPKLRRRSRSTAWAMADQESAGRLRAHHCAVRTWTSRDCDSVGPLA